MPQGGHKLELNIHMSSELFKTSIDMEFSSLLYFIINSGCTQLMGASLFVNALWASGSGR